MSARFVRRGVTKIFFVPAVADIAVGATRAEITAGTDMSAQVAEVAGWLMTNQAIPTPDLGSSFESSIPGTNQTADSSLTFYEDLEDETLEEMLPPLTPGFVVFLRKGDKPTSKSMDTFPVRVASKSSAITTGNEAARWTASFGITGEPSLDQPVPAAAA